MAVFLKILQFVGVTNVAFIIFNGSYEFSSEYFSNTVIIVVLLILVILSFVKDALDFVGLKLEYEPLVYLSRLTTILVTGVLSSFVILIPKLLFIESHQLDSMHVKFTARITRIWSKEELSTHLSTLIDNRGVSHIITSEDRNYLVETSSSMGGLKDAFNSLVNERLASLTPKSVESENIVVSVVNEPSWASENVLLVVVGTVVVIALAAGIGYFIYQSYTGSDAKIDDTLSTNSSQTDDSQLDDTFDDIFNEKFITENDVPAYTVDVNDKGLRGEIESVAEQAVKTELDLIQRIDLQTEKLKAAESRIDLQTEKLKAAESRIDLQTEKLKAAESHLSTLSKKTTKLQVDADALITSHGGLLQNFRTLGRTTKGKIRALEQTRVKEGESLTAFMESMESIVDTAVKGLKEQILSTEELEAVRILLGNETIRDILKSEGIKKIMEDIKKGGD